MAAGTGWEEEDQQHSSQRSSSSGSYWLKINPQIINVFYFNLKILKTSTNNHSTTEMYYRNKALNVKSTIGSWLMDFFKSCFANKSDNNASSSKTENTFINSYPQIINVFYFNLKILQTSTNILSTTELPTSSWLMDCFLIVLKITSTTKPPAPKLRIRSSIHIFVPVTACW